MQRVKNFVLIAVAVIFALTQPSVLVMAQETSPSPSPSPKLTGPQQPTGPQVPTGPQGPTGPASATGPQTTPGPQVSTGPVSALASPPADPTLAQEPASTGGGSAAASNDTTGANSDNTATVNQDNTTTVSQTNTATTNNTLELDAGTGQNQTSFNTGSGTTKSGTVNGQLTVINVSNAQAKAGSTVAAQSLTGDQSSPVIVGVGPAIPIATNSNTGADSSNVVRLDQNTVVAVSVINNATANNTIAVDADTGNNEANFNTGSGNIETGDVNLAITLINLLNMINPDVPVDLNVLTVFGDLLADLLFPSNIAAGNSNTGSGSSNDASATVNNDLTFTTSNNATITNAVDYDLTTGENEANFNTGGGSIESGTATAQTAVANIANAPANMLWLINVYGACDCDLSALDPTKYVLNIISAGASNDTTGANSDNQATINQNNDVAVSLTNNGTVNNTVSVTANTGGNGASFNTGSGNIKTGDINVFTGIINLVNTTVGSGQRFSLGVINIMGDWLGKAGIFAKKPTVASSSSSVTGQTALAINQSSLPASSEAGLPASAASSSPTVTQPPTAVETLIASQSRGRIAPAPTSTTTNDQKNKTKTKTKVDIDTDGTATIDITIEPSPAASPADRPDSRSGGRGWFATAAHAATENGIIGSRGLPTYALLAIPLLLWLAAELIFGFLIRRRRQKQS